MQLIYVHGLDSGAKALKGQLLMRHCQMHYPELTVLCPDLNQPPQQALQTLLKLATAAPSALVGSSLGGYLATLVHNQTGCPVWLLNPSTQPHLSLRRLFDTACFEQLPTSSVGHVTSGGWQVRKADLQWLAQHPLMHVRHPQQVHVLLGSKDELLDPQMAQAFYQAFDAKVVMAMGADHRLSGFAQIMLDPFADWLRCWHPAFASHTDV